MSNETEIPPGPPPPAVESPYWMVQLTSLYSDEPNPVAVLRINGLMPGKPGARTKAVPLMMKYQGRFYVYGGPIKDGMLNYKEAQTFDLDMHGVLVTGG